MGIKKRASLDNEICEICGEEFRASPNLEKNLDCELTWVEVKGKMALVCDGCKNELKNAK
jgi:hypothetical protein